MKIVLEYRKGRGLGLTVLRTRGPVLTRSHEEHRYLACSSFAAMLLM
jgi:hypothetical protein